MLNNLKYPPLRKIKPIFISLRVEPNSKVQVQILITCSFTQVLDEHPTSIYVKRTRICIFGMQVSVSVSFKLKILRFCETYANSGVGIRE